MGKGKKFKSDNEQLFAQAKKDNILCDGEVVRISSLKPDPMNARLHGERNLEAIKTSLALYGQRSPLVVRKENRVVAAGNGRMRAMLELGWTKCAATIQPMTDEEFIGFSLADNRTAELAEWDTEVVKRLDALLRSQGQKVVGWTEAEIRALRVADVEGKIGDDELSKSTKAVTRRGDLWHLGNHRLLCGDSTVESDVRKLIGDDRATLVFTDPPYGVNIGAKKRLLSLFSRAGRNQLDIKDDSLAPDDLKARLLPAFKLIKNLVARDDCSIMVTAPQGGDLGIVMLEMLRDAGLATRHILIWVKNSHVFSLGRLDYDYQHEPILFTWMKSHKRRMLGDHRTSVWSIPKPMASSEHPTMKPVELVVNAIMNHTDEGDYVYDPYVGSGTSIIACERQRRKCLAMEIDPHFCDVAVTRWESYTGGRARRVPATRTN